MEYYKDRGMLWELAWPTSGGSMDGMIWRETNPTTYLVEIAPWQQSPQNSCVHCVMVPATHELVFFGLDEGEVSVCADCAGDMVLAGQVLYTIPWVDERTQQLRGDGLSWKEEAHEREATGPHDV